MIEITQIRHSKAKLKFRTMALPNEQNCVNLGGFQHLTRLLHLSPFASLFSC